MSVRARRKVTLTFSGDIDGENEYNAAENTDSPAYVQTYRLPAGNALTFVIPSGSTYGGPVVKSVTILKDPDYAGTLILKGHSGAADNEGIHLHPTDPDSFSIDASNQSAIILKASADCDVRLVWS